MKNIIYLIVLMLFLVGCDSSYDEIIELDEKAYDAFERGDYLESIEYSKIIVSKTPEDVTQLII